VKNEEYSENMLKLILKRMELLPMRRSTDWIMEFIKERVEVNLEVFGSSELTTKLCSKNIDSLEKLPQQRKATDFNISLLREKFGLIIHLMKDPEEEYKEGGEKNLRIATTTQYLDGKKSEGNNGEK